MNVARSIAVAALLLSTSLLAAQSRRAGTGAQRGGAEISVRISYDNGRPAAPMLRVELLNPMFATVTEGITDGYGVARILGVTSGNYRLKITGPGIEDYTSNSFYIDPLDALNIQMVTVRRTPEAIAAEHAGAPISAAELNIPEKARKQFERGQKLLTENNPTEAIKYFTRASTLYPQYAAAFDYTGMAIAPTSAVEAKRYFQRAIEADKQYEPGYRHLAKSYMGEKQYGEAERLLTQATTLDPRSAETLFLLAYSLQKQEKHSAAIETVGRAHQLAHAEFATIHLVAGESYSRLGRIAEAVNEYNQYLLEAPLGPSAEIAKQNISVLQTQLPPK
jgi:tetratricopeptide (TPR) repeat protein